MKRNSNNRTVEMDHPHRQRGVALVIALVLLIAVTLVGLAGIRGTTLQEQMAGNYYDREVAFQAAEAALALGTQEYRNTRQAYWDNKIETIAVLDCSDRTCALNPQDEDLAVPWESLPTGTSATGFRPLDLDNPPQYVVQRMGDCSTAAGGGGFVNVTDMNISGGGSGSYLQNRGTCYRITARAYDPARSSGGEMINAERAQVILQATWRL
ncbi:MAG: PilX N-terminal domain-containing pilus assembly protein [Halothiobacillaceae bacterium]